MMPSWAETELKLKLSTLSYNKVSVLQWVPAHVGNARNEIADWHRQQKNFLSPTSQTHTEKSRTFWNRRRNYPGAWKTMEMTHRKTTLTPLTKKEDPNHQHLSTHRSLCAKKTSEEIGSCWFSPLWLWLRGANSWAHTSDLPKLGDHTPTVWPEETDMDTKLWGQAAEVQQTADWQFSMVIMLNAEEDTSLNDLDIHPRSQQRC